MHEQRESHGLIKINNLIYVFGGHRSDAEKHDLNTNTWTMLDAQYPETLSNVN